ncbi:uncharacterized protein N0V89_007610 [Didymosphaeria variabile]|uniref:Kinesin motor domain-containing protein n=1 Tax=Didymosphaeria variabile TaxID=1932322 RepID=A0A9W8XLG1_9PLEO|nr:uncharacterized protein N0V89_007610 [Didymosphaeria variabile]KAJ4352263.1 hypothetical protein N0V89_007610 [Didymosphaeria variabile]
MGLGRSLNALIRDGRTKNVPHLALRCLALCVPVFALPRLQTCVSYNMQPASGARAHRVQATARWLSNRLGRLLDDITDVVAHESLVGQLVVLLVAIGLASFRKPDPVHFVGIVIALVGVLLHLELTRDVTLPGKSCSAASARSRVPLASEIHACLPFLGMPLQELRGRFDGRLFPSDDALFEKRLTTVAVIHGTGSNPMVLPLAELPSKTAGAARIESLDEIPSPDEVWQSMSHGDCVSAERFAGFFTVTRGAIHPATLWLMMLPILFTWSEEGRWALRPGWDHAQAALGKLGVVRFIIAARRSILREAGRRRPPATIAAQDSDSRSSRVLRTIHREHVQRTTQGVEREDSAALLQAEIKRLQELVRRSEEQARESTTREARLSEELSEQRDSAAKFEAKVKLLQQSHRSFVHQSEEPPEKLADQKTAISSLEAALRQAQKDASSQAEQVRLRDQQLAQQSEEHARELAGQNTTVTALERALKLAHSTAADPSQRESSLHAECTKQVTDLSAQLSGQTSSVAKLEGELSEAREALTASSTAKDALEQQVASLTTALGKPRDNHLQRLLRIGDYPLPGALGGDGEGSVLSVSEDRARVTLHNHTNKAFDFGFDYVFDSIDNDKFATAFEPYFDRVVNGGVSIIMTDGPSSSGKSHTLVVGERSVGQAAGRYLLEYANEGILIKAAEMLSSQSELEAMSAKEQQQFGVTESAGAYLVTTPAGVAAVLAHVERKRTTRPTNMNKNSSRKHLLVEMSTQHLGDQERAGRLVLLDVCGAERQDDVGTNDHTTLEINRTRSQYQGALRALRTPAGDMVQHRRSGPLAAFLCKNMETVTCKPDDGTRLARWPMAALITHANRQHASNLTYVSLRWSDEDASRQAKKP